MFTHTQIDQSLMVPLHNSANYVRLTGPSTVLACISSYDLACVNMLGTRRVPVSPSEHDLVSMHLAFQNKKRKHAADADADLAADTSKCGYDNADDSDSTDVDLLPTNANKRRAVMNTNMWLPTREDWFAMHLNRWSPVIQTRDRFVSVVGHQVDNAINRAILMRLGQYRLVIVAPWAGNLDQYMTEQADTPPGIHASIMLTHHIEDVLVS